MPKVSLTATSNSDNKVTQKGPAPDYSMLLEMKRRSLLVSYAKTVSSDNGRKGTGVVVDAPQQRGFTEGPAVPVLMTRGARLGFFKF